MSIPPYFTLEHNCKPLPTFYVHSSNRWAQDVNLWIKLYSKIFSTGLLYLIIETRYLLAHAKLRRLQLVQNTAAHTPRLGPTAPGLISSHWRPVKPRVLFQSVARRSTCLFMALDLLTHRPWLNITVRAYPTAERFWSFNCQLKTVWGRAFSCLAPCLRNRIPSYVTF